MPEESMGWQIAVGWSLVALVFMEVIILLVCALKKKFIPASDINSATKIAQHLESEGFVPIINLLGEHYTRKKKVDKTVEKYQFLLGRLGTLREKNKTQKIRISIKPTQIGLAISSETYKFNINQLIRRADTEKIPLEIDMESLKYLDETLKIYRKIRGCFDVRQAVQAYLKRSRKDISDLIGEYRKVRLVLGAYGESDLNKSEARAQMNELAEQLIILGNKPSIATIDNRELLEFSCNTAARHGILEENYEFQLLYGRADDIKEELKQSGKKVAVYVPVGPWYKALPYIWRRIKEIYKSAKNR